MMLAKGIAFSVSQDQNMKRKAQSQYPDRNLTGPRKGRLYFLPARRRNRAPRLDLAPSTVPHSEEAEEPAIDAGKTFDEVG
ncbi:hypothetical protein [Ensifer aridi]|uniref:hypothetical protein n=1 Tax=Ensifer aridi TaxID=1708715 RepID=UPI00111C1121|nr:hypothetical protein [Ensifer aridi]